MSRLKLQKAYDCLTPSPAAKVRMMNALLARTDARRSRGHLRRLALAAAVNVLVIGLAWTAYRSGWLTGNTPLPARPAPAFPVSSVSPAQTAREPLSLEALSMGLRRFDAGDKTAEGEFISLQGVRGSPEYEAALAWQDFLDAYDPDGSLLQANGGYFNRVYNAYLCYTPEMEAKIDALCEQYGLSLLSGYTDSASGLSLSEAAGVSDFLRPGLDAELIWYYTNDDGSFHAEGSVRPEAEVLDFQLIRAVKGSFSEPVLNIGRAADYEQWTYTTAGGTELLLARTPERALLAADLEGSFVTVNLLSGVGRKALEAFAELIDFAALS